MFVRVVVVVVCALALVGCANFMKKVSGMEDVDMTAPEKLDEPASGDTNGSEVSRAVKQLRGIWEDDVGKDDKVEQAATFLELKRLARETRHRSLFEDDTTGGNGRTPAPQVDSNGTQNGANKPEPLPKNSTNVSRAYFEAGIALSDMLCSEWFNRVALARIAADQTSDWLSSTATAANAILGFTGNSSEVMGIVGSALGFGKNITQDTINNYLLQADMGELEKALIKHRDVNAKNVRAQGSDSDYFRATTALVRYHDTCTPRSVKALMTAALRAADPKIPTIDPELYLANVARDIAHYFLPVKVTGADVVDLFLFFNIDRQKEKTAYEALVKVLKTQKLLKDDGKLDLKMGTEERLKDELEVADSARTISDAAQVRLEKLKGKSNGRPAESATEAAPPAKSTPLPAGAQPDTE